MFSQNESAGKFTELLFIRVIMPQEILAKKLLFCVAVSQLKPSQQKLRLNLCTMHFHMQITLRKKVSVLLSVCLFVLLMCVQLTSSLME